MNIEVLKNLKILYVEDDKEIRNLTLIPLKAFINEIITADDGLDGLKKFSDSLNITTNTTDIDLILTDINMPHMDGLAMVEKIKDIDSNIPIILISAYNDSNFLKKAIDLGVSGYIMKPIDIKKLVQTCIKAYEPIFLKNNLELKVKEQTSEIRSILDSQQNIIVLTDGKEIQDSNIAMLEFFNVESIDYFKKEIAPCICFLFEEDDLYFHLKKIDNNQEWIIELEKLPQNERNVKIKNINNQFRIFNIFINKYFNNSTHYVISLTDITELKEKSDSFEYLANHDNLTKLYNRQKFNTILEYELKKLNRNKNRPWIVMLDIDYFKKINDTFGHDIGDYILVEFSNILRDYVKRATDTVCRWGGEEFIILIPDGEQDSILEFIELLRVTIENRKFDVVSNITVSIGLTSCFPTDTKDTVIKRADEGLYLSKRNGRNRVTVL